MDVRLNTGFLRRRVAELGIEQWWIAERLGVNRRTVSRWLNGNVRQIRAANLSALADLLSCAAAMLEQDVSATDFATDADQRDAALLIERSGILEALGPGHQFDLAEKILKASLVPDLPKQTLGNLLNQLSIACWRQSKLDASLEYAKRALAIAETIEDDSLRLRATMNVAHHRYWSGDLKGTIELYERCAERAELLQDGLQQAANLSNLGDVYYEYGDFERSRRCQEKAIALYRRFDIPVSLAIAHAHLVILALELDDLPLAQHHLTVCGHQSVRANYRRGQANCPLFSARIAALEHRPDDALRLANEGLSLFRAMKVQESGNHRWAGRAFTLAKHYGDAERELRTAMKLADGFPIERAFVHLEHFYLARDQALRATEQRRRLEQAIAGFAAVGADPRVEGLRTQMSHHVS